MYEEQVAIHAESARDRDTEAHNADCVPEQDFAGIYARPKSFYHDAGDYLLPADDDPEVHERLYRALRWDEIRNHKYHTHDLDSAREMNDRLARLGAAILTQAKKNGLTVEMMRVPE